MAETSDKVARFDWHTIMSAKDGASEDTIKALDAYFSNFAALEIEKDGNGTPQVQPQDCCGCGKRLTGPFGTWRWGIVHGLGECGACGWPSHGHHFIYDNHGEHVLTLNNIILQIHPDFVERHQRESTVVTLDTP